MMTGKEASRIKRWFTGFVRKYESGDADLRRNMILKEEHTLRVCREAAMISRQLGLSDSDSRLAYVIALTHDVGRFEQYSRYRTFADPKSENHARLSLRILRRHRVFDDLDEETRTIIRRAILYHNRPHVPERNSARVLFFSRLLRDADKLDIWKVVLDYYTAPESRKNHAVSIGIPDLPGVTPGVLADLRAHRIVNSKNIRTLTDFKLLQMGWVFDLNYQPTFKAVHRRRYVEKLREVLPAGEEIEEVYRVVSSYLRSGCQHKMPE